MTQVYSLLAFESLWYSDIVLCAGHKVISPGDYGEYRDSMLLISQSDQAYVFLVCIFPPVLL